MTPISLCRARQARAALAQKHKRHQDFQEALRTNITLGLGFKDPPGNKSGPHFAWAFLDPEWVQDILDRISMFQEYSSRIEHLEEMVFRDYLIHYGMGDLEKSELASRINQDLTEEGFMPLPIEWDYKDDDPSYRTTPEDSLLVINYEGVHWRIATPTTGTPTTYLHTHTVPSKWFEMILEIIK